MSATVAVTGWLTALVVATAARHALARRMELVERACHELRGPLTAARLALHLAAPAREAPCGPLEAVELELGRARLALSDLAEARRGRRTPDRIETFELVTEVAAVVFARAPSVRASGRRLELERPATPVLVRGDRLRCAQAVGNLIANALEHGAGEVLVRVRAGLHTVRVEVLDEGPGLPAPVALLVARPRADRGRGLAIAADVAARHGGRLAAAPSERGARLVLELPTAPRPA